MLRCVVGIDKERKFHRPTSVPLITCVPGVCGPSLESLAHKNTTWPTRSNIQRRVLRIIYSYTNDMPYINALYCAAIPSLADGREQLSRKSSNQSKNPHLAFPASYLTHRGSLHYNSTKIRKQISSPTQPYEKKISDIYFLRSVSLSDFIAIQPSILVICSCFFLNFLHVCLIAVV